MVENQTRRNIKALRIDNGGESVSHEFDDLCQKEGIKRELTIPYNPRQNRVVERKNVTIYEATKVIMCDKDLPLSLWTEATSAIVYIHNRIPHAILEDKTLDEAFTRVKPEVGHLRIFCCLVHIHVPKEKRMKMGPSRKKGMFIGYSETLNSYHIYVIGQR